MFGVAAETEQAKADVMNASEIAQSSTARDIIAAPLKYLKSERINTRRRPTV